MANDEHIDVLLPPGSKESLRKIAAELNMKPSEYYRKVMLAAMGAVKSDNGLWHTKLEAILNSGDDKTISAVTQNVEYFHERLRPAQSKTQGWVIRRGPRSLKRYHVEKNGVKRV